MLLCMSKDEAENVREDLERYIQRQGHGSIGRVAQAAGVTRQYLGLFRKGEDVEKKVLMAIRAALYDLQGERIKLDSLREDESEYRAPSIISEGRTFAVPSAGNIEQGLILARRANDAASERALRELQDRIFTLAEEAATIGERFERIVRVCDEKLGG